LFYFAREATGAASARHSLRPLIIEGIVWQSSGALRREIAEAYVKFEPRHCEEQSDEAIHSSFARRDGLLRFARNDVLKMRHTPSRHRPA